MSRYYCRCRRWTENETELLFFILSQHSFRLSKVTTNHMISCASMMRTKLLRTQSDSMTSVAIVWVPKILTAAVQQDRIEANNEFEIELILSILKLLSHIKRKSSKWSIKTNEISPVEWSLLTVDDWCMYRKIRIKSSVRYDREKNDMIVSLWMYSRQRNVRKGIQ